MGCAGQVLGHASIGSGAGEGVGHLLITALGEDGGRGQSLVVEGIGDGQGAAGEQFPHLAIRISLSYSGHSVPSTRTGPPRD
ncbi:hypothetical protein ACIOTI_31500 [Streptomyces sp. NPDC087843]|uniref:hypothetical protein n=1 Tax=Streptomyces sp. NPDC087843 TaxID=3365804 RepID=UPI00382C63EB